MTRPKVISRGFSRSERRATEDVAKLLILNAEAYSGIRSKEITRCVVSHATIARFSNRRRLDTEFMRALSEDLFEYGWSMLELQNGTSKVALVRLDQIENWVTISDAPLFSAGVLNTREEDVQKVIASFGERGYTSDDANAEVE